jgi:hypothetical protein
MELYDGSTRLRAISGTVTPASSDPNVASWTKVDDGLSTTHTATGPLPKGAAITLDFGPNKSATRAIVTWDSAFTSCIPNCRFTATNTAGAIVIQYTFTKTTEKELDFRYPSTRPFSSLSVVPAPAPTPTPVPVPVPVPAPAPVPKWSIRYLEVKRIDHATNPPNPSMDHLTIARMEMFDGTTRHSAKTGTVSPVGGDPAASDWRLMNDGNLSTYTASGAVVGAVVKLDFGANLNATRVIVTWRSAGTTRIPNTRFTATNAAGAVVLQYTFTAASQMELDFTHPSNKPVIRAPPK